LEELSRVAHGLGEVVGLGLRNLANCPVEMNLMPDSTLRWQSFNQKKPYLIATVVSLVLVTFAVGFLFAKLADNKKAEIDRLTPQVDELSRKMEVFKQAHDKLQKSQKEAGQIAAYMQQRYYWGDFLADMRRALIRSEDDIKKKFSAQKPGVEVGIWIEQITSAAALNGASSAPGSGMPPGTPGTDPRLRDPRLRGQGEMPPPPPDQAGQPAAGQSSTNAISFVCRAVSLKITVDPSANNKDIAYAVRDQIASSPLVNPDPKATQLVGEISQDDANGTFTFTVNVTPLNPLNF
jgi:hypothetical protein